MKILIDMQAVQSGSSKGGIGRYAYNLLESMVQEATSHKICILLNENLSMHNYDKLASLVDKKDIYIFSILEDTREDIEANSFRSESSKLTREYTISLIKPDILLIMSLFEGLSDNVITSVGEIFPSERTAVILYDLIPLVEKSKYLIAPLVDKHYMSKIFYLIQSGVLLSISKFSKDEAMDILKLPNSQIVNISSAIDKKFKKTEILESDKKQLLEKYGIKNKFLMFTGSFDVRKNQENLIRAFASVDKEVRKDYQLLIVGNGPIEVVSKIKAVVKKAKLHKEDVLFLGHITDEELLSFYNLCSLFVFATLREGFGLPALEAMACGVATIGSNTTSIPEVINRVDALFDPKDISSIANKISQVLENDDFSEELKVHGLSQSKNFSWDISAKKTLETLEERYNRLEKYREEDRNNYDKSMYRTFIDKISKIENINKVQDNELIKLSNIISENIVKYKKKEIGIITTWNTRCGIASYSKYLTQKFINNSLIFAPYIDTSRLTHPDEINTIRSWKMGDDNLETLFEMIVDRELQVVLIQFNYGFFNFNHLNNFIENLIELEIKVYITLHSTTDPFKGSEKELKVLSQSLLKCTQIFIHTKKDIKNLNKINITKNITQFNQGIIDIKPKDSLTYQGGTFRISTYGFFLESKGLINSIKAIKILIDNGENISLLMLNAKYSDEASNYLIEEAESLITQYNLANIITLNTNYLSDKDTIEYLSQTDLVIFPYTNTGESSSASVRMAIAAQRYIAVTPQPIFDEISDFIFKFEGDDIDSIVLGIQRVMQIIKKNDSCLDIMNSYRDTWVKKHRYSKLSAQLKGILSK